MCFNFIRAHPNKTRLMKKLYAVLLFLSALSANAQHSCGTAPAPQYLLQEMNSAARSVPTFTIPVVFHLYYGDYLYPLPISYQQLQAELDNLNERFNLSNADTALVYSGFKSIMGDAQIKFELARKDENGNCISGIYYHYCPNGINSCGLAANLNTNKYMNVHVTDFAGGSGGYAFYPTPWSPTPSPGNHIVIVTNTLGTSVLTHEAGHWLNLHHTFGPTNQTGVCGDDYVLDTPETPGDSAGCNVTQSICNPPIIENVNNYMDYSSCTYMFTQGQVSRMHATLLDTTLSRREIWTAPNLAFTGVSPVPACSFSMAISANAHHTSSCSFTPWFDFIAVPFSDLPDSVKWNFPNALPSSSALGSVRVQFLASGPQTVTLTAWRMGTAYTYTTNVNPTTQTSSGLSQFATLPFIQNFENGFSLPHNDLYVIAGDTTWKIKNTGYNSDSSLFIPAEHKLQTDTNKFVLGVFDMRNRIHPQLSFKVATSHNSNTVYRKLFIYMRNRCTNTERIVDIQYDSVMAGSNTAAGFIPTAASQWKNIIVNLSTLASENYRQEIEFRFELVKYFSGTQSDENFYLDNINLYDSTATGPPAADFSIENIHFCYDSCYELELVDRSAGNPIAYSFGMYGVPNGPVTKGCFQLPPMDTVYIYLTVYNEFGSSQAMKPVYIHVTFPDSITVTPPDPCPNDTIVLQFHSDHTSTESYLWTNSLTPNAPYTTLVDSAGAAVQAVPTSSVQYHVEVQNVYGCTGGYNKIVNVTSAPVVFITQDKSCISTSDSAALTASYVPSWSYSWAPASGLNTTTGPNVIASPNTSTVYTLTVSDVNCSSTQTAVVNVPAVYPQNDIVTSDSVLCNGQSTMIYAASNVPVVNTWTWNPCCFGSYAVYSDSMQCGFTGTTTVTLTSTDTNGCAVTSQQVISVSSGVPNFWVHPFNNNTFYGSSQVLLCSNADSVCVFAQGAPGNTYAWSASGGNSFLTNVNGEYATVHIPFSGYGFIHLTATDSAGCSITQQFTFNRQYQGNFPAINISPSSLALCENATNQVFITPFSTNYYYWMPTTGVSNILSTGPNPYNAGHGSTATITGTATMTYTVTALETGYGCVGSKLFQVTAAPSPQVDLSDTMICTGNSHLLDAQNAGSTFLWSTGETTQSITVSAPGQYYVTVTGSNGCATTDTADVQFGVCLEDEEAMPVKDFSIGYSEENIILIPSGEEGYSFAVYDVQGRKVLRSENNRGSSLLNSASLSSGVYFFVITTKEKEIRQKVFVR